MRLALILIACFLGCTAAKRQAIELQLAKDCRDYGDSGLPEPGFVKLACDAEETTVLFTVPKSTWFQTTCVADAGHE